MKVLMQPIDMVAWFDREGNLTPVRYRMPGAEEESLTVRVDRVLERKEEKTAGNRMLVFKCRSVIDEAEKVYEMKYEIGTCRWYLYKI